jgi:hypothetical protein
MTQADDASRDRALASGERSRASISGFRGSRVKKISELDTKRKFLAFRQNAQLQN